MTIDDIIEKLNAIKARHGNVEVVLNSEGDLVYRDFRVQHRIVWGNAKKHRNFVKYEGSLRIKDPGDDPQEVVIIQI